MPTDNSLDHLHPELARVYTEAKAQYLAAHPTGLKPRLGETYRSLAVQAAYYAQGRKSLTEINKLRHVAGLNPIGLVEAKSAITKAQPGQSPHNFLPSRAFDVELVKPTGDVDWTEANYLTFAGYVRLAANLLKVDISQGAYWIGFRDYPHTELKIWRTMP